MGTPPAAPEVRQQVRLDAPAHVVWRHVVGRDWLGFPGDDEPGAGDRVRLRDPFGGDGARDARVLAVDAGRRLALEWWPAGRPDDASTVEIALEEDGAGTTDVHVVEQALPDPGAVTARAGAWSSCMQALAGAVGWDRSPLARRPW